MVLSRSMLVHISTINATLHSNHTLTTLMWDDVDRSDVIKYLIANRGRDTWDKEKAASLWNDYATDKMIKLALKINIGHIITSRDEETKNKFNAERAGREKLIYTQLYYETRKLMAYAQEVRQPLISQVDPIHLPEVLSLVGRKCKLEDFYIATRECIVEVLATVNGKKCLQQKMEYHIAQVEAIRAELEAIEAAESM